MECRLYRHKIQTSYHELSRIQYLIRHYLIFCDQCVVFSNNYRAKGTTAEPVGRMQQGGRRRDAVRTAWCPCCQTGVAFAPPSALPLNSTRTERQRESEKEKEKERESERERERENVKHGLRLITGRAPLSQEAGGGGGHALTHGSLTCF